MRIFWWGPIRGVFFWLLTVGTVVSADFWLPWLDLGLIWETVRSAVSDAGSERGAAAVAAISEPGFATSLAWALVALGAGFLVSFLFMHALLVHLE